MRLFVALDLPWELRQRVAMLAGAGIPGARWVPPENYHVTLRFIGETPAYRAEEIDHALASLKARGFSLTLAGVGTFARSGRSTSLWVGVERNPQLDHLQNKIETALQRIGLEPERRRFAPHVYVGPVGQCGGRRSWQRSCRRTTCSAPSLCRSSISPCSARCWGRSRRCTRRKWNTRWHDVGRPPLSRPPPRHGRACLGHLPPG